MAKGHAFQAPTGTRDFYPADMLRRRYIEKMWRDTSIRHGFEEIDGPTFEHLDLYTVKSGEGIINELFSFKRAGGEKDYALRPEFTPTLARMYAAKAGGLAKPTKWFTAGPFFRAERPQRGRLREFLQWNVDAIGGGSEQLSRIELDACVITCLLDAMVAFGLDPKSVILRHSHRGLLREVMRFAGLPESSFDDWFAWLDLYEKLSPPERVSAAARFGGTAEQVGVIENLMSGADPEVSQAAHRELLARGRTDLVESSQKAAAQSRQNAASAFAETDALEGLLTHFGAGEWCQRDIRIVRGLAYYTGSVFELIADGQRAVAGGGRYDNLIELFGGPPTPAVGFGMGDVVLGLLLQDKELIPEGRALLESLSAPAASVRPEVFVIANDKEESENALRPLVACLRRGAESEAWRARSDRKPWDRDRYAGPAHASERQATPPLHARHSYKATKNIGKLLQEASACHARFAAILESGTEATLKNLDTGEQMQKVPPGDIATLVNTQR